MTATTTAARDYIQQLSTTGLYASNPELQPLIEKLKTYHDKKLWHQLTTTLEQFINAPHFVSNKDERLMSEIYEKFFKDFEAKINQFVLVKILSSMATHFRNPADAVAFLQKAVDKLKPEQDKEAYALGLSEIALIQLVKLNQLDESKVAGDKASASLEQMTGADPHVFSRYYKYLSLYYKVKVSPTEFYKNSLLYLVYTQLEEIPVAEQQTLAFDMGIAALVSPDINNFGELLAHPVLKSLEGTKGEWLLKFLFAFNSGDIEKFDQYLATNKSDIEQQPIITANMVLLRQKISILALMELVFNKPSEDRTIPFPVVAKTTRLPQEEVELLVMKALSLKLIRGTIDEVGKTVTINWVQPRVLDLAQIAKVRDRVQTWIDSTHQVLSFMEDNTAPELYA